MTADSRQIRRRGESTADAAPGGGDASDILPEELLGRRLRAHGRPGRNASLSPRAVRGEFELLQRELATKIGRLDRDCEIVHEDRELIVYALSKRKDLAYVLDYCEIEDRLLRRVLVDLLASIAEERGEAPAHPLVVRKPTTFRAGERHALERLQDSEEPPGWIRRLLGSLPEDLPEPPWGRLRG
jgi:hypothetical protein